MSFQPFNALPVPTPDPLFAIGTEAARAGPAAINGTLGIVMDEEGMPLLFPSVRSALTELAKTLPSLSYSYPPLTGVDAYRDAVTALLPRHDGLFSASIASTGGTGALAINLRLLAQLLGSGAPILLPTPAWGNHPPPCRAAGLSIVEVPYLQDGVASEKGLLASAGAMTGAFGVLLQVGCHNPTGLDLSREAWVRLADALADRSCVAVLDTAYQGFIGEPEDDVWPIQLFLERGIPTLVTWSASKNHAIYGLRTGLAVAYVPSKDLRTVVEGHYSSITRTLHSAAPTFGQRVVACVQERHHQAWREDLRVIRTLLVRKRSLLSASLPERFSASLRGHGMFARLPLTEEQVVRLKEMHRVYLTLDGRINIAGIPERRIEELAQAIQAVA